MKEINIGKRIIKERRQKEILQEELAEYMGVSKAAVSKWENEQSYPDITLLPKLAAYFNISIDDLLGYQPQMEKDEIMKLYKRLSSDFACKPPLEVMEECESIIKKYYSCCPLLRQMALLFLNHYMLFDNREYIFRKVVELTERIRQESDDAYEMQDAAQLETMAYLQLGKAPEALSLLDESLRPMLSEMELLCQVYQLMGKLEKAKEVSQIALFQHLVFLLNDGCIWMMQEAADFERSAQIISRILTVAEAFQFQIVHPGIMATFYVMSAQVFAMHEKKEEALEMLHKYEKVCLSMPKENMIRQDDFFYAIGNWMKGLEIGDGGLRNFKVVKESMIHAITDNPYFKILEKEPLYKTILHNLNTNIENC